MAANQQFCLRWNNHQRTLISVFDSLLESGTLVDCTLAAEGQYLKAHKVVLSACSPYLGVLLSQHHEKHPILILKDIKFQELKAMLDYMYRGEVNISQEQLCTFLKAAESLQIKGLTESAGLNPETKDFEERLVKRYDRKCPSTTQQIPNHSARTRSPPSNTVLNASESWNQKYSSGTNFRSNSPPSHRIRDGSLSPTARKRRKQQHPQPSVEDSGGTNLSAAAAAAIENHQDSSVDSHDAAINPVSSTNTASNSLTLNNIKTESNSTDKTIAIDNERCTDSSSTNSSNKLETAVIPKTEPKFDDRHSDIDAAYEDSVEEMTIEDEEEEIDENDLSRPGPSHSDDSQNYGSSSYQLSSVNDGSSGQLDCQADQFIMMNDEAYHWPSIDEGENEIFSITSASPLKAALSKPPLLQMPDLMQNSASKSDASKFITCVKCGRQYKLKSSLLNHQRWECGKEPQFKCVLCNYKAKQKVHLVTHMRYKHALKPDVFTLK